MVETTVKERPILFSGPMVQALLAGRKTQTRRAIKPQPIRTNDCPLRFPTVGQFYICPDMFPTGDQINLVVAHAEARGCTRYMGQQAYVEDFCPYGVPGDRLWVRETWCPRSGGMLAMDRVCRPRYRATEELRPEWGFKWRPSIHMPRWASRLTLEVTEVRVERVQDISETDAVAEGASPLTTESWRKPGSDVVQMTAVERYAALWDSINGNGAWALNPWVWCVSFKLAGGAR